MLKSFYRTKNIIGLVLMLVPAMGFLFYANSVSDSLLITAAVAAGIPAGKAMYGSLSFRFWLCFVTVVSVYSVFIMAAFPNTAAAYIGAALLGLSVGSLVFILPPNITAGWFHNGKFKALGVAFSISILAAYPVVAMLNSAPLLALAAAGLMMVFASVCLLDKPSFINRGNFLDGTGHARRTRRKLSLFFLLITLSLSFACRIGYMALLEPDSFSFNAGRQSILIYLGMAAGPSAAAFLSDKKGAYSSSVFLIFLSELAIVCAGFYSGGGFMAALGRFAFGASLSSLLVVCPMMIYYMMGPASYNSNLGRVSFFLPLGLMLLFPLKTVEESELLSTPAIFLILLALVVSFFIIFSAWKHRFVLLK